MAEGRGEESVGGQEAEDLQALLNEMKSTRGVDLTGYKRTTLRRRILRRMGAVGVDGDFTRYRDHLREQPQELSSLLDSFFINVTSFFRDRESWAYLAAEVIPRLVAQRPDEATIRVWSAGCASGEEPFSVAMLLAEHLGLDAYARRVKIYATDWDELALQQARRARYPEELEAVPEDLRHKYFQNEDGNASLHHILRRSVIYGQHDLVADAPISRVDLLLCRNTLMYFNIETQARILSRLHFALAEDGVLFLGRAEMLLSHTELFIPIELRHRIFGKRSGDVARREHRPPPPQPLRRREEDMARSARLREASLEASPVAQVVLDPQRRIAVINHRATLLFPIGPPDLGRPLQDLELSYRPVDLRSMIDESLEQRRGIQKKNVEYRPAGRDVQYLDVSVAPLFRDGHTVAITLTFNDVTHHHELQESLQRFSENLETACEELQSSLRVGVAVVSDKLEVEVWNQLAADLWGLRAGEVIGRPFADLAIGLPVKKLVEPIRDCLAATGSDGVGREIRLDAINRRGRELVCRVLLTPLTSEAGIGRGVCILMEDTSIRAGNGDTG